MRPGQGNRRNNNNRRNGHGGGHSGGGGGNQGNYSRQQPRTATSLRNQIFDSNGPDTRVRGNAFQVHEKYQALAKDALSSGDRVLAENYLQHAEHYYRIIEAINEATASEQRQRQAQYGDQQPQQPGGGFYAPPADGNMQQPQMQAPMGQQQQRPLMDEAPGPETGHDDDDMEPNADGQVAVGGRR